MGKGLFCFSAKQIRARCTIAYHCTHGRSHVYVYVCVCVCVCLLLVFLFRLPAEEDSNSGLQGGSRLHGRCTTRRKLWFPIHPSCFPCPECFPVCVWRGGGTQHTINLGYGNGSARAPPRAVFMVCCAVQN